MSIRLSTSILYLLLCAGMPALAEDQIQNILKSYGISRVVRTYLGGGHSVEGFINESGTPVCRWRWFHVDGRVRRIQDFECPIRDKVVVQAKPTSPAKSTASFLVCGSAGLKVPLCYTRFQYLRLTKVLLGDSLASGQIADIDRLAEALRPSPGEGQQIALFQCDDARTVVAIPVSNDDLESTPERAREAGPGGVNAISSGASFMSRRSQGKAQDACSSRAQGASADGIGGSGLKGKEDLRAQQLLLAALTGNDLGSDAMAKQTARTFLESLYASCGLRYGSSDMAASGGGLPSGSNAKVNQLIEEAARRGAVDALNRQDRLAQEIRATNASRPPTGQWLGSALGWISKLTGAWKTAEEVYRMECNNCSFDFSTDDARYSVERKSDGIRQGGNTLARVESVSDATSERVTTTITTAPAGDGEHYYKFIEQEKEDVHSQKFEKSGSTTSYYFGSDVPLKSHGYVSRKSGSTWITEIWSVEYDANGNEIPESKTSSEFRTNFEPMIRLADRPSQPVPDQAASKCEGVAFTLEVCEATRWTAPRCNEILRRANGCRRSPAVSRPTDDNQSLCVGRSTPESQLRAAECKSKGMITLVLPDEPWRCIGRPEFGSLSQDRDPCDDPAAMCLEPSLGSGNDGAAPTPRPPLVR